jgi:hypothetical protein
MVEWQVDRAITNANANPGIHEPVRLPSTYKYINQEMYKYLDDSSVSVTVIHDVPLSYAISGITLYVDVKTFVILIASKQSDPRSDYTLLHEWGHVFQMYSKDLIDHGSYWTWKGHEIDFSIPWGLRPWEIQADSIATYHQRRLFPFRTFEPLR